MRAPSSQTRSPVRDIAVQDRSIAFLIAAFLLACYLITYTGVIQSSDGLAMFATTESLVRRGEADANQILWMGLQQGSFGPDGDLYSRKGLGVPLLAWPLVWLAHKWLALGLVQTALLLNPLLTAWTGGLLYRAGMRLGWPRIVAGLVALVFGLATLAWPYSQTFFSDPVAGWGLFGALYGLLAFSQTRRKRYLFLAGLAWGLAYLVRSVNLVTLPFYALALAAILWERDRATRDPHSPWLGKLLTLVTLRWRVWVAFGLPVLAAGLASLWWNWLRYGSPWTTGYLAEESFSGPWGFGIFGLLLGPARGLLWYSPVLILAIPGAAWFWRRQRWLLGLILGVSVVYVLLYGKWFMWHGGFSWGPRFLVALMPLLALLTGPAWLALFQERRWGGLAQLLAALLLLASLAVQWLGMAVPFGLVQEWLAGNVTPLFAPETFTRLGYSPLLLQFRFLQPDRLIFAWWRAGARGPDWFSFGLILAAVTIGAMLIARQVRLPVQEPVRPGDRLANWLFGLAFLFILVTLLARYQAPLSGPTNLALARQIAQGEEPGDAILHLRPTETQQFANAYHGDLPTFGLSPREALSPEEQALLARLQEGYRRLWLIPDPAPPDQSGWERALRQSSFLLLEEPMGTDERLALFASAQAQPLTETGLGTIFGLPEQAGQPINEENGWVRLNGYGFTRETGPGRELLVALEWQSLRPVDRDFQVFVHLLNEQGEKLAQRDGQPVLWLRPTSTWQPGERIVDRYGLLLPDDLPPGEYRIAVGLYDAASGQRLPVSAGPGDFAIELGPIQVVP